VRYVLRHDTSKPPVRFVAIKSGEGRKIASANSVDPDDPHTFIFVEGDKSDVLTEAVFAMAKRVGGPWRFIRMLKFVPLPIRDWFYARLANNRYALFGKLEACYMPTEATQHRFVLDSE
jgi:predicted DCC family thiol-disulfide oxidoreductase YuxK